MAAQLAQRHCYGGVIDCFLLFFILTLHAVQIATYGVAFADAVHAADGKELRAVHRNPFTANQTH